MQNNRRHEGNHLSIYFFPVCLAQFDKKWQNIDVINTGKTCRGGAIEITAGYVGKRRDMLAWDRDDIAGGG